MSDRKWEQFFAMINDIVDGEGSHTEKKNMVLRHMKEEGADINFEEFVSWFSKEDFK